MGAKAPAAAGAIPKLLVPKNVEIELKLAWAVPSKIGVEVNFTASVVGTKVYAVNYPSCEVRVEAADVNPKQKGGWTAQALAAKAFM